MQVKELRKDASVQQSLRSRAAKAWLLQRWPLCIAALLLLTLLAAAALQFRSNGTDGAGAPGQQSILASMRCILMTWLKSCSPHQCWSTANLDMCLEDSLQGGQADDTAN